MAGDTHATGGRRARSAAASAGGGHGHPHGHGHGEHAHEAGSAGLLGRLKHLVAPHSRDAADSVDVALAGSAEGRRVEDGVAKGEIGQG